MKNRVKSGRMKW